MNSFENELKLEAKWAEIDLDALAYNIKSIRKKIGNDVKIAAVVKANGYGHGMVNIVKTLYEAGADQFAVASLNEALELRKVMPEADILVLGIMPFGTEEISVTAGLQHTVSSCEKAEALSKAAEKLGAEAKVHIKLDTGMTRIGFQTDDEGLCDIINISELPNIELEGVFTHFARADEADKKWAQAQYKKYCEFTDRLKENGVDFKIRHAANSAAIMEMPDTYNDMVRPGIVLYGIYPSGEVDKSRLDIKPAMTFKARITHIKRIGESRQVSYGGKYEAAPGSVIGTVAAGYADGYSRAQSGRAEALYKGRRVKVVGNICMDQCMIDISEFPEARAGDEIVLMGADGAEFISADEVAERYGTIGYEVVCAVSRRVPRYYIKGGKIVGKEDYLR